MTTSACVNLHFKLTIASNARYREHLKAFTNYCKHYKINEHSRNPSGVLSVSSTIIMDYFGFRQFSYKLTITSNARYREHLKAFANYCKHYKINEHSRNPSGVLLVSSTIIMDYFGLRQSSYKPTITSNARYRKHLKPFANSFEHYKINEHSRNSSGVLSVAFDHYHDYCGLRQSLYKLTITTNARYREHLNVFASSCEHHKINEHSCNPSGVLSVTFDYYH